MFGTGNLSRILSHQIWVALCTFVHPHLLLYFCEQNKTELISFEGAVEKNFFYHRCFQLVSIQCGFLWTCILGLVTMQTSKGDDFFENSIFESLWVECRCIVSKLLKSKINLKTTYNPLNQYQVELL